MKNKNWLIVGLLALVATGAAVWLGTGGTFKGSFQVPFPERFNPIPGKFNPKAISGKKNPISIPAIPILGNLQTFQVTPIITTPLVLSTNFILGIQSQPVALFSIRAQGTRNLNISALTLHCIGNKANHPEFADSAMGIWMDEELQSSFAENGPSCREGRRFEFPTPIEIQAGTEKFFDVRMDTTAAGYNWNVGENFAIEIQGQANGHGGLEWFYAASPNSRVAAPTAANPSNLSSTYPVTGPLLTY